MAAYNPDELRSKELHDPHGVYDKKGWVTGSSEPTSAELKEKLSNGENGDLAQQALGGETPRSFYGGRGLSKRQPLTLRLKNMSNRRKVAIGGSIAAMITTIILSFFLTSSFELLQFKHLLTDKIAASENHTYSIGQRKLYSTQFFFDKNGQYNGDKVGGIRRLMAENRKTNSMIKDLSDNGYKINFGSDGKVKSLQKINEKGEVLASYDSNSAAERAWDIKNSGDLDKILKDVYPDKSSFWYSRSTAQLYRRWNLTRTDWLHDKVKKATGVTAVENIELKFRQALRDKMFGPSSKKGGTLGKTQSANGQPDKNSPGAANQQAATALSDGIFADAADSASAEATKLLNDPTYTGAPNILDASSGIANGTILKNATEGTLKGVLSAKTLSLLGADQNICVADKALGDVVTGARVLRAAQLMNFALSVMNIADAVQNGQGVSSDEVNAIMQYLNSTDKNGKNIFESSGWKYWMDPGATGLFSSYDQNQRDEYSVGGGFTGTLASIKKKIDGSGVAPNCSFVNNPLISWGALGVSIGLGIISGGTITGADTVYNLGISFATNYAVAVATQLITPMVGGYIINGAEQGTGVGNALVSGMEVLASVNGSNSGMRPLTTPEYKSQLAAIQQDQEQELSHTPILARLFSPNQDNSLTNEAVIGLASLHSSTIFNSFSHFSSLFHFGNFFGQPAMAASSSCTDSDITSHNLATTPFCNLITGIPDSVMNDPNYAPDVVDQKMSCVDNAGNDIAGCTKQVDINGNPMGGSDYEKYVKQCTYRSPTAGVDVIHNDSGYTGECTNNLYNAYTFYLNLAGTDHDILTGNLSNESANSSYTPPSTTDSGSGSSGVVSGDAKQLAQQILKNKNIQFAVVNQQNIYDNSTAQANMESAANGQPANTSTTCSGGVKPQNSSVNLDPTLLQFILDLGNQTSFTINELAGGCHDESNSNHYKGTAVDFGCAPAFNAALADKVGQKYGISDGTGEYCSNKQHYHYSIGGN